MSYYSIKAGVFITMVLITSCIKINEKPQPTPLSSYNMSAYANGEFLTFNASCNNDGDSVLSILGVWNTNISEYYDMDFYNIKNTKKYIGTYTLNSGPDAQYYAVQVDGAGGEIFSYGTGSTYPGSLSITAYDSINKTISGTFSFTGVGGNSNGTPALSSYPTTINITNGVFTKLPL